MPSTFNILSADNQLCTVDDTGAHQSISSVSHSWTATGAALSVVNDEIFSINHFVLQIAPSSPTVTLSLTGLTLSDALYVESTMLFHSRIKCASKAIVDTTLKLNGFAVTDPQNLVYATEGTSNTVILDADNYTVCRSNTFFFVDTGLDINVDINIVIAGHEGNAIYLTLPCLINDDAFFDNPFVRTAKANIPDIYWEIDKRQTNPRFPLFKLIDTLSWGAGDSAQLYSNFFDYEKSELNPEDDETASWAVSTLTSAEHHDSSYRRWLAQFTGTTLKNNIYGSKINEGSKTVNTITRVGTTATATTSSAHNFVSDTYVTISGATDSLYNGTFKVTVTGSTTFTYTMSSTPSASAAGTLRAARYGAKIFLTEADADDYTLWQVTTGYYGYNAGTLNAIKEAAKWALKGTQFIQVYSSTPWIIDVVTITSETPDKDALLNAILPAKPAGYSILHTLVASAGASTPFTLDSGTFGQLDDDPLA